MKHAHSRIAVFDFRWPEVPLNVVLVNPEIPPNTGNIARLCAATGSRLHLVEPLGFRLDDYWDAIRPEVHPSWEAFLESVAPAPGRMHLYSTGSGARYDRTEYRPGDTLVFGCETKGLPQAILDAHPGDVRGIPMMTEHVRSLNLSTAVGIVVYHALHELDAAARKE